MVRENWLGLEHLIYPFFVLDGENQRIPISSLPGLARLSEDELLKEVDECMELGLRSFVLFPAVEDQFKDQTATYSYADDNFYLRIIRAVKERFPEASLMSDVAMDPYSATEQAFTIKGKGVNRSALSAASCLSARRKSSKSVTSASANCVT